ncbi:hypothetical protein Hanom_Chr05g00424541 [Helianthus anomalus]
MAASNRHFVTPQYCFISGKLNNSVTSDPMFEFELANQTSGTTTSSSHRSYVNRCRLHGSQRDLRLIM